VFLNNSIESCRAGLPLTLSTPASSNLFLSTRFGGREEPAASAGTSD
jgi:hypothetical protein